MIKLLRRLLIRYKNEKRIFLSWDAASWHASKSLYRVVDEMNGDKFRNRHSTPLIELMPLPSGAQFLNVIESVFSGMSRAILHNSNYGSVQECKTAIDSYFAERNLAFFEHPKRAGKKIWGKEPVEPVFREGKIIVRTRGGAECEFLTSINLFTQPAPMRGRLWRQASSRFYYVALSYGYIQPDMSATEEGKKSRDSCSESLPPVADSPLAIGKAPRQPGRHRADSAVATGKRFADGATQQTAIPAGSASPSLPRPVPSRRVGCRF